MPEMPKMKKVISDGLKAGTPRPAARLTDVAGHAPAIPGAIVFGTPIVIIGGQIAARMGDPIKCEAHGPGGNITMGSITVIIAGAGAARMGDPTACCAPGVAGQGAPAVAGGPGSFDGPSHEMDGYDNEDGAKRTDKFSGGKMKKKIEIFGIEIETADEFFSGKSDFNYSKKGGGAGGEAEGAVHTETTTIQSKDSRDPKLKITEKEGSGSLKAESFSGKKDSKTGFGMGFSAQATAAEKQIDIDEGEIPIPFTDWSFRRNTSAGVSAGIGQAANAGAYHDEADDRYHLNGMLDIKIMAGLKLGFDFSVGKKGDASSGSPGAGAAGLAGTISSGCMTVLIGG